MRPLFPSSPSNMIHIPENLIGDLDTELRRGWQQARIRAEIEKKNTAVMNAVAHKSLDGVGSLRMRVPGDAYHYWGQRLGYECWSDPQFLKEFERDNPEVKVKSIGTGKTQIGYTPTQKRFSKSYGPL